MGGNNNSNQAPSESGIFRKKKGFTIVGNNVARDTSLSLKAKGLYMLISSFITIDNFRLSKKYLIALSKDGKSAFESAWNDLKSAGYLKVYSYRANNGQWQYEYELLDEVESTTTNPPKTEKNEKINNHTGSGSNSNKKAVNLPHPDFRDTVKEAKDDAVSRFSEYGKSGSINNTIYNNTDNSILFTSNSGKELNGTETTTQNIVTISYDIKYDYEKCKKTFDTLFSEYLKRCRDVPSDSKYKANYETMYQLTLSIKNNLMDMCGSDNIIKYKNNTISYSRVIDRLNEIVNTGGIYDFISYAHSKIKNALANRNIKNINKYIKSIIWESLNEFQVKSEQDKLQLETLFN